MGSAAPSAAVIVLVTCLIAIGAAQVIGTASETLITVDYHSYAGELYLLHVQDLSLDLRLWLAGTRCFKRLPSWIYTNFYRDLYSGVSYLSTGHSAERIVYHNAEFVAQLRCR